MQFLTLAIFMHIFVGMFMLTNPTLFATITQPGEGMKMPTLAFNPGDELRDSQDIEDESENQTI
jgi:hypothetical protein